MITWGAFSPDFTAQRHHVVRVDLNSGSDPDSTASLNL